MSDEDKIKAVEVNLRALEFDENRAVAALAALRGDPKPRELEAPLLSPDALCEQLRISRTTLWRLKPPSIQVGGRKRYDRGEVMAFLAKQN